MSLEKKLKVLLAAGILAVASIGAVAQDRPPQYMDPPLMNPATLSHFELADNEGQMLLFNYYDASNNGWSDYLYIYATGVCDLGHVHTSLVTFAIDHNRNGSYEENEFYIPMNYIVAEK